MDGESGPVDAVCDSSSSADILCDSDDGAHSSRAGAPMVQGVVRESPRDSSRLVPGTFNGDVAWSAGSSPQSVCAVDLCHRSTAVLPLSAESVGGSSLSEVSHVSGLHGHTVAAGASSPALLGTLTSRLVPAEPTCDAASAASHSFSGVALSPTEPHSVSRTAITRSLDVTSMVVGSVGRNAAQGMGLEVVHGVASSSSSDELLD